MSSKVVDEAHLEGCIKKASPFKEGAYGKLEGTMCVEGVVAYTYKSLSCKDQLATITMEAHIAWRTLLP